VFGALALVGTLAFVLGVQRNAWWIIIWMVSGPLFAFYYWRVVDTRLENAQWHEAQALEARVQAIIDDKVEFEATEQAAQIAAERLRSQYYKAEARRQG
jgi:hypothetical protein